MVNDAPATPATGAAIGGPGVAGGGAQASEMLDGAGLRTAIELLFFAYRDFTGDADGYLARYQFGRAHHRVIYFVGRTPGITVSDLLGILKISKQSLAPVLAQLVRDGFVVQRADKADRRRRRLYLSPEAEALEQRLTERQARRIAAACRAAGAGSAQAFCNVLRGLMDPPGGAAARPVSEALDLG
jgi:DNA-binding MarR family transcriptional regulator